MSQRVRARLVLLAFVAAGCLQATQQLQPIASLEVAPAELALEVGQSLVVTVGAVSIEGAPVELDDYEWTRSALVDIAPTGKPGEWRFTGRSAGVALLSVEARGLSAQVSVKVAAVTVPVALQVNPAHATVEVGAQVSLAATADLSDGSRKVVTGEATWSVSDSALAGVTEGGIVTGRKAGQVTVAASLSGFKVGSKITVVPVSTPTLVRVDVSPATARVDVGARLTLKAMAVWGNGSSLEVSDQCLWSSSDGKVAQMADQVGGAVSPVGAGTATITATFQGKKGTAVVTVKAVDPGVAIVVESCDPLAVAVDGTYLYFVDPNSCDGDNAFVGRVPKSGGPITKIAQHQDAPVALVVDSAYVYWLDEGYASPSGAVWRARKDGSGSPQQVVGGLFRSNAMAIDDAFVFAGASDASGAGDYHVARVTPGNPTIGRLETTAQPFGLASDGESLFVGVFAAATGHIERFHLGGQGTETILDGLTGVPRDLALDQYYVYFVDEAAAGSVQRAARDGTMRLTYATSEDGPAAIAVDDASVYWLDRAGEVKGVPKNGGTVTTLGKDPLGNSGTGPVHSLVVDEAHLYWPGSGRIYRVSKLGTH
jgi:hypothetical protein